MKKKLMVAVLTAMFFCGFSQNGNSGYDDKSVIIKNGKLGFVDKNGNVSTPIEYTSTLIYTISWGHECSAPRFFTETMALEIPSSFNGSYSALLESHRIFDISAYSIPGWVEKNGKWGFVNRNGKMILPFKYVLITGTGEGEVGVDLLPQFKMTSKDDTCESSLIVHQENGKWGVVDFYGDVIPCKYDEIKPVKTTYGETDHFLVEQNGKWGVVAKQTLYDENTDESKETWKQILPCKYDTNEIVYDGYFMHKLNGKWGVVNSEGKQILPCKYDTNEIVYGNGYFMHKLNGKWGVFDSYDILPCKYDDIRACPCDFDYCTAPEFMVKENNKWGVLSAETASNNKVSLEQTIPCEYDDITTLEDFVAGAGPYCGIGYFDFAVKQNGKWGILGEQIVPCKYDNLKKAYIAGHELIWCREHVNCHVIVQQNNKWGIINPAGKQIIPCKYDEIITPNDHFDISGYYPEQTIFKIKLNGKWGAITVQLNEEDYEIYWGNKNHIWADVICKQILPCEYEEIAIESSGYEPILKIRQNGKWGVVAKQTQYNENTSESKEIWKQILPCKYEEIAIESSGHEPILKVRQNGKWGVFVKQEQTDKNGESKETWKQILPCEYDTNEIVYEHGYFLHKLNGKWGVVNSEWKQILPCKYDEIKPVEYKYGNSLDFANSFKVKQNGKWGVVNSEGKQILPCKYEKSEIKCEKFYDQLLLQAKDKFGIMNSEGELLLPCEYDSISEFEGFLRIKKSSHYGLLTSEFKTYLPCEYQQITALDKGYLMLVKNGKYGIMTDNGNTILKCEFDSISTTNGNILMKQNGKWGVLNGKGAIPCKYVKIVPAGNFYAVKDGNVWGLVGAAGNTIMKPTYKLENIEALGGFLKVTQKRRCGLLDGNGKLMLPIAYEEITVRDGSSFFVKQKGKWGVADHKGTIVVPCKHVSKSEISR